MVTDRGLEPRTNCLRGNCSAIELVGLAAGIIPQRLDESIIIYGNIMLINPRLKRIVPEGYRGDPTAATERAIRWHLI